MASVRDSAAREIVGHAVRDAGGVLRTVVERWVRDAGGVPRQVGAVAAPMTAVADPGFVTGARASSAPVGIRTNTTTVNVGGGTAPLTYTWTGPSEFTITDPSAATTAFIGRGVAPGDSIEGLFNCTVTDARGLARTAQVTAVVNNYGGYNGQLQ